MADPTYNYGAVGTGQFDPNDPSVMGRVTGDTNKASIDEVNIWMRTQPWYQQIIAANGGNANSDQAKAQITKAAQQNGVQVDQSNIELDNSGNFKTSGMATWEKVAIVAGIAAATIATMGAAGVFTAAAAGGEAGSAAAVDAGVTAAVDAGVADAGLTSAGMIAGEAGLTTGAAGAAGALGAIPAIAGSTGGLEALGAGAGLAAAGGAAPLASTATGTGLASGIPATGSSLAPTAATAGGLGTAGTTGSTLSKVLGAAGQGIGQAGQAAGQNNLNQEQLALQANQQNIAASGANTASKNSAIADIYRASLAKNPKATSPYATIGAPTYSPAYLQAQTELEQQAMNRLGPNQTGSIAQIPLNNVQGATGTTPSTLQNISQYAGPALSVASKIPWSSL